MHVQLKNEKRKKENKLRFYSKQTYVALYNCHMFCKCFSTLDTFCVFPKKDVQADKKAHGIAHLCFTGFSKRIQKCFIKFISLDDDHVQRNIEIEMGRIAEIKQSIENDLLHVPMILYFNEVLLN